MAIYVAVVIVFIRFALFIGFCRQLNLVHRQSAYVVRVCNTLRISVDNSVNNSIILL